MDGPELRGLKPPAPSAGNCARRPAALAVVAMLGADKVLRHVTHKRHRARRHIHVALEHALELMRLAVIELGIVRVLGDAGSVEVDAGEEAFVAGVAEELGIHLPVGGGGSVSANGAGGSGGIATDFELAFQQVLEPAVIDSDEDEVS